MKIESKLPDPLSPPGFRVGRPGLRRVLIWGVMVLAVIGALSFIVLRPHAPPPTGRTGRFGGGPTPVVAAAVKPGEVDITLDALGTVTPLATVTVKTQIAGQLTQVGFREGQTVSTGDFLAQIDPRPYQAQLEQAQGQLLKDQALLKQAELDLVRYQTLWDQDSIARQTLDAQVSLVQQYRGAITTDQAQIDTAKLNLTYCHIIAPVGGRVGLRQVDAGNYVQTSDPNGIVVITQMRPMSVVFVLPEDNLPAVLQRVAGGATLTVTAFDRSQTTKLAVGRLDTVDNQIDTSTGTLKLRAIFDNVPEILFPNQFVTIQLKVDSLKDTLVMPTAAIQRGAPGTYVYLIKADNTVAVRPVHLGPVSGDNVAILSGLDAGDKVVVDGADKLREGAAVTLPADSAAAAGASDAGGHKGSGAEEEGGRKGNGEHRHRKDQ